MSQVGLHEQIFQHVEGCRIEPLQIVEEQRERMFRACEDADESPEHQLEPEPGILRRQCWHWRLFADDVLQFRNEIGDEQPVRPQRLPKRVTPLA